MAGLNLFPDERVVIQAAVYLVGLASTHYFLIRPLLALTKERQARTLGASGVAKDEESRIQQLESDYREQLTQATEEAKQLRMRTVVGGQAEAEEIIHSATAQSKVEVEKIRIQIESQVMQERMVLPSHAQNLAKAILERVAPAFLVAITAAICVQNSAYAAGSGPVDFWYGMFWPYFQFGCFALGLWFFGRTALNKMLEKKRDALRTQLSEARQATQEAESKVAEYKQKVASLEASIEQMRQQHAKEGALQRDSLIEEAKKMRDQILRDTERRADEIVMSARESLRRELIRETFEALQKELSQDFLEQTGTRLRTKAMELVQKIH